MSRESLKEFHNRHKQPHRTVARNKQCRCLQEITANMVERLDTRMQRSMKEGRNLAELSHITWRMFRFKAKINQTLLASSS